MVTGGVVQRLYFRVKRVGCFGCTSTISLWLKLSCVCIGGCGLVPPVCLLDSKTERGLGRERRRPRAKHCSLFLSLRFFTILWLAVKDEY